MTTGIHTDNEFFSILGQAVRFRDLTEHATNLWDKQAFSTATIFFCITSVEAAANSLLRLVVLNPKLEELVDKFPAIAKFDLVANSRNATLDRGSSPTQNIAKLIRLRNVMVHPKISTRTVEYETHPGDENYTKKHRIVDDTPIDGSNYLAIANDAVRATIAFLNYVVKDLLKLSDSDAANYLLPIPPMTLPAYEISALRALKKYECEGVTVKFINLPDIPGD